MRKLLSLLVFVFALAHAAAGWGENPAPLTQLQQVVALTNPQAAQHLPVRFEATVTFAEPQDSSLFVQDAGKAVYVNFAKDMGLIPGDRVQVTGTTGASFRPEIEASGVQVLGQGKLPVPQKAEFQGLIQSKFDCQYVTVRGHILAAAFDQEPQPGIRIQVQVPEGMVGGRIAHPGNLDAAKLLDAEVELTGVAGGAFDSKMQMTGVWLDIYSAENVKLVQSRKEDAWSIPLVAMDDVISAYRQSNQSQRVRIEGTLTYFEPAALAVVEANGRSMLVKTDSTLPLHAGMGVEATGFPSIAEQNVSLEYGQLRRAAQADNLQPQVIGWENAASGKFAYNLVAMEGEIVGEVHDSRVDLLILRSEGHLFSATLRHSSSDAGQQSTAASVPAVGSRVRVIGVCFLDAGNHWRDQLWFSIRMRSLDDVVVLQQPEWWTVKRMTYIVMALSLFILAGVIWVGLLDRQLRRQSGFMARQSQEDAIRERRLARQEQQRGRILELISSPAPLAEVLQEIQTTVSARLYGAACWFELSASAGASSRPKPERPDTPGGVSQELFSRDGTSLGYLMATPLVKSSAEADIAAILSAGARLAELAIDTRRLYSDLRHRSEYDLLTDVPNRFSMEKTLDRLMQLARSDGKAFGLIYVDLDRFKQVNDRHGHRVGDLYLQAVTGRMKQQLRNGDVLARIGGDEFIALVPIVRSRTDAEEIAMRLEQCFQDPFDLQGLELRGSASVGLAIYPEDGTTEEELQRAADAAMYAHKEYRRRPEVTA